MMKLEDDALGRNKFEKILPIRPLRIILKNAERLGLSVPLDPAEVMKAGPITFLRCEGFGRKSYRIVAAALREIGYSGWSIEMKGRNVFQEYPVIRSQVKKLAKESEEAGKGIGTLTILASDLMIYLLQRLPKINDENLDNFCNFIADIPSEIAYLTYVCRVDDESRNSKEYKYFDSLHRRAINRSADYREKFFSIMTAPENRAELDKVGRRKFS